MQKISKEYIKLFLDKIPEDEKYLLKDIKGVIKNINFFHLMSEDFSLNDIYWWAKGKYQSPKGLI